MLGKVMKISHAVLLAVLLVGVIDSLAAHSVHDQNAGEKGDVQERPSLLKRLTGHASLREVWKKEKKKLLVAAAGLTVGVCVAVYLWNMKKKAEQPSSPQSASTRELEEVISGQRGTPVPGTQATESETVISNPVVVPGAGDAPAYTLELETEVTDLLKRLSAVGNRLAVISHGADSSTYMTKEVFRAIEACHNDPNLFVRYWFGENSYDGTRTPWQELMNADAETVRKNLRSMAGGQAGVLSTWDALSRGFTFTQPLTPQSASGQFNSRVAHGVVTCPAPGTKATLDSEEALWKLFAQSLKKGIEETVAFLEADPARHAALYIPCAADGTVSIGTGFARDHIASSQYGVYRALSQNQRAQRTANFMEAMAHSFKEVKAALDQHAVQHAPVVKAGKLAGPLPQNLTFPL